MRVERIWCEDLTTGMISYGETKWFMALWYAKSFMRFMVFREESIK